MSWLLDPYRDHRTYAVLAYLLLGLPLGILDFTVVVTGLSVGLGMVVTLVGIPLLVGSPLSPAAVSAVPPMAWGVPGPIVGAAGVESTLGSWTIDTIAESLVFLPI